MQLTRFQRFIRRMESAGPKVILDRLKEDWQESTSDGVDEEVGFDLSRMECFVANKTPVDTGKTALAADWLANAEHGSRQERPCPSVRHRADPGAVWKSL